MKKKPNKVILITGSGRGIGAATAKLFASRGYTGGQNGHIGMTMDYSLCLNYHSDEKSAKNTYDEVVDIVGKNFNEERARDSVALVQADIKNEEEVMKMFETVDQLGTLSVLVNNAGILRTQSRLEGMTVDRWEEIFRTNVVGSLLCCREAIKRMSHQHGGDGGVIINISSIAALKGAPNEYIDYAASKGALDTITKGLANEVGGDGIRVNGVRPGIIHTDIHADGGEADRVKRLASKVPMKRGGQPNEVAEAVYWLASEKSSYANGAILDIAGGL